MVVITTLFSGCRRCADLAIPSTTRNSCPGSPSTCLNCARLGSVVRATPVCKQHLARELQIYDTPDVGKVLQCNNKQRAINTVLEWVLAVLTDSGSTETAGGRGQVGMTNAAARSRIWFSDTSAMSDAASVVLPLHHSLQDAHRGMGVPL